MFFSLPNRALSADEAVDYLARRQASPGTYSFINAPREAWPRICEFIRTGKLPAYVRGADGHSYEAARAQFAGLLDYRNLDLRGHKFAATALQGRDWRVFGELFIMEADLAAVFGSAVSRSDQELDAPGKKLFPPAREPELKAFLVKFAREQESTGNPNNEKIARQAAEVHFDVQISRELVRKVRKEAECAGEAGRPRKQTG